MSDWFVVKAVCALIDCAKFDWTVLAIMEGDLLEGSPSCLHHPMTANEIETRICLFFLSSSCLNEGCVA